MYGVTDSSIVEGLGKPTIKFEFDTNDDLKRFLTDNKETLIENYVDVEPQPEPEPKKRKRLNGIGQPPADVFNVPESKLKCGGFVPTYERLSDYSHLIDNADHTDQLTGYGFDKATIDTLIDTCQRYYKQVAKLAAHLKADTPAQSAFNVWHWLHTNIKYNYDADGKEEIRTPARSWADRQSGVDCDCLSVFTACLLINMGYAPKFEIVAFANKPQYSHIFVNLDGMAIDRVLPTFNRRPSLITKTLFMDIPVYRLSGVEDVALQNTLQGLYDSTLSKIAAGTASKKDKLDFRKTQVLVTLQGTDYNAFRLAGIIMPYVKDIDEQGGYYFDNEEIAGLAAAGENDLIAAELSGADEITLGKLFKKLKKAIKKVAKKVASGVKKVAKATTTAVKTVAKQTAKVTKAAVKSAANAVRATANVVKAGAQAATGKGRAAKATLKKAGQQVKKAVVQPVKTVAKATQQIVKKAVVQPVKTAVKVTVINPTKTAVKTTAKVVKATAKATAKAVKATGNAIKKVVKAVVKVAGKLFKVIFIKLNPATVLLRNSLRLLIAINFLGMATRLNVSNMAKTAAIAAGYTAQMWEDSKKAKDRVIRFFTKLGGKKANIEKSIVNGAKKKALFKKDYKPTSKIVESSEDNATLSGDAPILNGFDGLCGPATIGSALAAVGGFIAKIWKWIAKIVPKAAKAVATAVKKTGALVKKVADKVPQNVKNTVKDTVKNVANNLKDNAINKLQDKIAKKTENKVVPQPQIVTKKKSNLPLILGIAAGTLLVGSIAIAASKKKKRA